MAAMNTIAEEIERQIRVAFLAQEWLGSVPVEEAIAGVIAYRKGLNAQDSAIFDSELLAGRHPGLIVETVEIVSGRHKSLSELRRKQTARVS
jgi:hypothetical protein